ncbi:ABC transporter substrate-binding protein [Alicyclobacillus curvatus]|nr:ABC transporter substrate-binding protein [Alicyclobacillus curvatus]
MVLNLQKVATTIVIGTTAVALLAGCGGNTPGKSGNGNQAAGSGNTSQSSSSANSLTILAEESSSWTDNFNPFAVANLQTPNGTIYEPLFYFSTTSSKVYNMLGTNMQWSNGNKTLTVTVRSGVKWNDGTSFSNKDVVFTYNMLKQYPALDTQAIWKSLSAVKAVGSNQVEFDFTSVQVPFAQIVVGDIPIVPQHIWSKIQGDPSKWTDPSPVGTGPYMLDKFNAQTYTLKANSNYWGGALAAKELIYPAISSAQAANLQLTSGKLDWADEFLQNIDKLYVSKDPTNRHYFFPPVADLNLVPNLKNPLLANVAVRQAMSDAIDRQQIDTVGEFGYEKPANPSGLVLPNESAWLKPGLSTTFTNSISTANALLDKAGFKMGPGGIRVSPTGKKLSFNLMAPNGWTDWNEDESLIAQDLKKIGIQINVQEPQQTDWSSALLNHQFDLALESGLFAGNTPYQGFRNTLYPGLQQNYEQYDNPVVKQALDQFESTVDASTQKSAMYTIETQFEQDLPVIPLVYAAEWSQNSTKNFTGWPTASNPYVDPSPATAFADGIVLENLKPAH